MLRCRKKCKILRKNIFCKKNVFFVGWFWVEILRFLHSFWWWGCWERANITHFMFFRALRTPKSWFSSRSCPSWGCRDPIKGKYYYFERFVYQLPSLPLSESAWIPHYMSRKCVYAIRTIDFFMFSFSKIIFSWVLENFLTFGQNLTNYGGY